ncbi:unnamed protein product [Trichobilharzia regenti]|nr:unnamed protein product [Trichobilharzia regenti]
MLDFYRLVSLVPETDCLISSELSEFDNNNNSNNNNNQLMNGTVDSGDISADSSSSASSVRSSLGELLLPCLDLIDIIQLGVDIRIASPRRTQKRQIFQSKVSYSLLF